MYKTVIIVSGNPKHDGNFVYGMLMEPTKMLKKNSS